jgi:hypothetical protein
MKELSLGLQATPGIGDGWAIYNFLPERLPSKRTKS